MTIRTNLSDAKGKQGKDDKNVEMTLESIIRNLEKERHFNMSRVTSANQMKIKPQVQGIDVDS